MKLHDYRETYYEFSGKASDIARNLAFAGIALVWIFKVADGSTPIIPKDLLFPTVLLALTLALDLLQYVSATAIWGFFQWYQEKKLTDISENPDLAAPKWFKLPQLFFFILKLVVVLIAYCSLTVYIFKKWFF